MAFWHLFYIIPLSGSLGFCIAAMLIGGKER